MIVGRCRQVDWCRKIKGEAGETLDFQDSSFTAAIASRGLHSSPSSSLMRTLSRDPNHITGTAPHELCQKHLNEKKIDNDVINERSNSTSVSDKLELMEQRGHYSLIKISKEDVIPLHVLQDIIQ